MGCWNETCGITNLPVSYNDKAVLVPLVRDKFATTEDEQWIPAGLPVFGRYDDYGGIVVDPDNEFPEYSEQAIGLLTRSSTSSGALNTRLSEWLRPDERLDDDRESLLIHREAWDDALEYVSEQDRYDFTRGYITEREAAKSKLDKIEEEFFAALAKKDDTLSEEGRLLKALTHVSHKRGIDASRLFPFYDTVIKPYLAHLDDYVSEQTREQLLNLALMDRFLRFTRRGWNVRMGKGSQDSYLEAHIAAMEAGLRIAKRELKKQY